MSNGKQQAQAKILAWVAIVGCVLIALWFFLSTLDSSTNIREHGTWDNAAASCKFFVRERLVSPTSADFAFAKPVLNSVSGVWLMTSYVDSQNKFGALVRTRFTCEVKKNGSSWEAVKIILD